MQTTREVIVSLREFATGVKAGKDQFHAGHAVLFVHVHRHSTAIVFHAERTVAMEDHVNPAGVASQGFVNAVINDFLGQMVRATGVGVHARAFAYRVQTTQNFDGIGVVQFLAHGKKTTPRVCY